MQAMTKGQLLYILDQLYEDRARVIYKDSLDYLFERYGDGYYKDYSDAPFELVEENPTWREGRGKFDWIPTVKE